MEKTRETGIKAGTKTSLFLGLFIFCIYLTYAYAFFIGSLYIDRGYENHAFDRNYSPGDVVAIFFSVLIGFFSMAGLGPNVQILAEGKASGKLAFDIIDKEPNIKQDDEAGKSIDLKGKIEFKNVDFFYPTRPD